MGAAQMKTFLGEAVYAIKLIPICVKADIPLTHLMMNLLWDCWCDTYTAMWSPVTGHIHRQHREQISFEQSA
jgi:hypothetical protein